MSLLLDGLEEQVRLQVLLTLFPARKARVLVAFGSVGCYISLLLGAGGAGASASAADFVPSRY